jgi:hypothetical protein
VQHQTRTHPQQLAVHGAVPFLLLLLLLRVLLL